MCLRVVASLSFSHTATISPLRHSGSRFMTTMSPSLTMASIIESPCTCRANRPSLELTRPRVISRASSAPKSGESVPGSGMGSEAKTPGDVLIPVEVALLDQPVEVVVHHRGRSDADGATDLPNRRRIAVFLAKALDETEHPVLTVGERPLRHACLLGQRAGKLRPAPGSLFRAHSSGTSVLCQAAGRGMLAP